MSVQLLALSAETYERHPMHTSERVWTETNCYIDVWVEVLHALGLDPVPAASVALSADFQGDQWIFLKFDLNDLRLLYGIDVNEMNVWRATIDHAEEQIRNGRLLTIEADSWFLPDTAGVSYQLSHTKSTIVPQFIDRQARRLGYFHNAGYFELSGDDFDGVFRLGPYVDDRNLPPYVELVRLSATVPTAADLLELTTQITRRHLAQRPADNPAQRLIAAIRSDMSWLASSDIGTFHLYAFGMIRQFGVTAELAATLADWLVEHGVDGDVAHLRSASAAFSEASSAAKAIQFRLARLVNGRTVDIEQSLVAMADSWGAGIDGFVAWAGSEGLST